MNIKIAIIGQGYVGLPLTNQLSKYFKIVGFDTDKKKINNLKKNKKLDELGFKKLDFFKNIIFTSNISNTVDCNFYIICVPTPVNLKNLPDFSNIKKAIKLICKVIKPNDTIVCESTFFPGTSKEVIIPLIEKYSGLKCATNSKSLNFKNTNHFSYGYSPERINPGDKKYKLNNIVKIVSASNTVTLSLITKVYKKIIKAGIFKAESIEIAEGSKVIENIQRDINIALVNELKIIFDKLNIDINKVLKAAGTKWNFLKFKPGLVGGHCISVDPYYLAFKSKKVGYNPRVLLSGRNLNNIMYKYIFNNINNGLKKHRKKTVDLKILILGFSYKENISDFRNTQIIKLYRLFKKKYKYIDIFDPLVDKILVKKKYNLKLINSPKLQYYDSINILVNHDVFFKKNKYFYKKYGNNDCIYYFINNIIK